MTLHQVVRRASGAYACRPEEEPVRADEMSIARELAEAQAVDLAQALNERRRAELQD
jgi:hypothetical protein